MLPFPLRGVSYSMTKAKIVVFSLVPVVILMLVTGVGLQGGLFFL